MSLQDGYPTPEEAAIEGFPPHHCRIVASRVAGDDAFVLLDAGGPDHTNFYGCSCRRTHGGGRRDSSSNMEWSWFQRDDDGNIGTLAVWGEAPEGAISVRLDFGHTVIEEAITGGIYLVLRTNVPDVGMMSPRMDFVFES